MAEILDKIMACLAGNNNNTFINDEPKRQRIVDYIMCTVSNFAKWPNLERRPYSRKHLLICVGNKDPG